MTPLGAARTTRSRTTRSSGDVKPITPSLTAALDRIEDFRALHDGRPLDEAVDAVLCLQEAVGIDEDARAVVKERIYGERTAQEQRSPIFLGVIIGLLTAEFARDRSGLDSGS